MKTNRNYTVNDVKIHFSLKSLAVISGHHTSSPILAAAPNTGNVVSMHQQLVSSLLASYDKTVLPTVNSKNIIFVNFTLGLRRIINLVSGFEQIPE